MSTQESSSEDEEVKEVQSYIQNASRSRNGPVPLPSRKLGIEALKGLYNTQYQGFDALKTAHDQNITFMKSLKTQLAEARKSQKLAIGEKNALLKTNNEAASAIAKKMGEDAKTIKELKEKLENYTEMTVKYALLTENKAQMQTQIDQLNSQLDAKNAAEKELIKSVCK